MRILLLSLCVLFSFGSDAWAWGDNGHKIVCEIAMRIAAPSTRAEIRKLIKTDSEFDFFSEACTWPDHPRKRADEHFLNLSRDSTGLMAEDCGGSAECVVTAILKDAAILSSKTASKKEKLASLKFLGHWVGDVHQPLHVSFKDDRGGNSIDVSGVCSSNLHSTWDTCLVLASVAEDVDDAANDLMQSMTSAKIETWIHSEPMDWANESFAIAEQASTKYCERQGSTCSKSSGNIKIDKAYVDANSPIVREQLQKAGARLAHLLDAALGE